MAPAELHLLTERVAALLNRLPGGDKRLEKAIQSLQRINQALVTIACLVDCYGDVFRCEHVVDSVQPMVEHYEALGEREHSRNPLVRRRSSHGEELEGIALLSREIFMSIMQFAL
jgi:succinyl-CoA synthetase beta subunit